MTYITALLIGGVVLPLSLHFIAPQSMPWWPDTLSMAIAFGATAIVLVGKYRSDREMNRRFWRAIRALFYSS